MPFTPFHMGPGLAIKAVAGRRFSLLTFGIAQVAMDVEPLVGMVRGSPVLHGASHTYLAAFLIAALVTIISPPIARPILRRWNRELSSCRLEWLAAPDSWSAGAVAAGAFVGTLSHVALDSIMHSEIAAAAPWSNANDLLGIVSIPTLHLSCVVSGLFGVLVWGANGLRRRNMARGG